VAAERGGEPRMQIAGQRDALRRASVLRALGDQAIVGAAGLEKALPRRDLAGNGHAGPY